MGKVFTWEEVRDGKIPGNLDFTLVLQRLRNTLSNEPSIVAAGVCGSVVRGDHNRRSDIDCVVIFDAEKSRQAYSVMQHLSLFAHQLHVPLSFIENDSRMVQTRMHHLGPSFVEHMGFSMRDGGLIKGRPLEMLAGSVSRQAGIEEYLRFKMHYLQAHWAHYPAASRADQAQFLQKSLEAPLHIARKVLSWRGQLLQDSKRYILEEYFEQMSNNFGLSLERLHALNKEYDEELSVQLERPHEVNYAEILSYLAGQVPDILEFVTQNLLFIAHAAR